MDETLQEVGKMKKASAIAQTWLVAVFSILSIAMVWYVGLPPPFPTESKMGKVAWSVCAALIAIVCILIARSASADHTEKSNAIFAFM